MTISNATDLDFLSDLMRAKQKLVHSERLLEDAKTAHKSAKTEMYKLMDQLEPHVQRRRDDLHLPKLDLSFDWNDKSKDPDTGDDKK